MTADALNDLLQGPWALIVMSALVLLDAFLVLMPGEIAVTTLGALSMSTGTPPLWSVMACAALAAATGDLLCYSIGRWVGLERWRWTRSERALIARRWAYQRLQSGTAVALFTARFIPFARLAVNLVAGATRIAMPRYIGLVLLAATGWAVYQAAIGALFAAILPGGPIVAILVSVAVAIGIGALIDLLLRLRDRRGSTSPEPP